MATSIASPVAFDPERYPYFNGADHLGLVGKILDVAGFSWFMLEVIHDAYQFQAESLA